MGLEFRLKRDALRLFHGKKWAIGAVLTVLVLIYMVFATRVMAHHSMQRFDMTQASVVEGVIKRVQWVNPHVYIYIDQITEDGALVEWEVEGFPPAILRRLGWTPETLRAGEVISVNGNLHRDGEVKSIFPQTIDRAGSNLFSMFSMILKANQIGEPPEIGAESVEGTWVSVMTIAVLQKFNPVQMSLTEAGAIALAGYDEDTMHPGLNCTQGSPPLTSIAPDIKRITAKDGVLILASDFEGVERTIHMNITSHEQATPSSLGFSIGRFEGKTLIIDTRRFSERNSGHGYGVPSGLQKHLMERITLSEDGFSLHYSFELSDPEFLATPITAEMEWVYRPHLDFAPEPCDLDSARRFLGH